jgi:hypothetical protein
MNLVDATVVGDRVTFAGFARFCAAVDGRREVRPDEEVELAVDNEHLHFFDADTGRVLGDPVGLSAARSFSCWLKARTGSGTGRR